MCNSFGVSMKHGWHAVATTLSGNNRRARRHPWVSTALYSGVHQNRDMWVQDPAVRLQSRVQSDASTGVASAKNDMS